MTKLTREFVCLVAAVTKNEKMFASARTDLDWAALLALADRHRVLPLLADFGRVLGEGMLPAAIGQSLSQASSAAAIAELRLLAELRRLLSTMAAAGVRPTVLKGLALSQRAFGRLGLRTNRDIDLIVRHDQFAIAVSAVVAAGYRCVEPVDAGTQAIEQWITRYKDVALMHEQDGYIVELHVRLFDNHELLPPPYPTEPIVLFDQVTTVALCEQFDLLYLCQHGAQHAWSRLKWLADVNALFARMPEHELQAFWRQARRSPHRFAVGQALLLCATIIGLRLPRTLMRQLRRSVRTRLLAGIGARALTASGSREIEHLRFGSTLKNASHYLLIADWRYWREELRFDFTETSEAQIDTAWWRVVARRVAGWRREQLGKDD